MNTFIPEYEEKYFDAEVSSIQLNNVHAVVMKAKAKFLLVGILFFKHDFTIEEVIKWLQVYALRYVDNENLVINAIEIIRGIHFKVRAIVLYKKGNKKISFNKDDYPEITEIFDLYREKVDTSRSKVARQEPIEW